MIYERALSVDVSRLTPEQLDAIGVASYQRELPIDGTTCHPIAAFAGRLSKPATPRAIAAVPERPSPCKQEGLIIEGTSRAPRARIEAHGDPRRMRGESAGAPRIAA